MRLLIAIFAAITAFAADPPPRIVYTKSFPGSTRPSSPSLSKGTAASFTRKPSTTRTPSNCS
jgi:uncharacterized protein YndB with AHSA1/START domain